MPELAIITDDESFRAAGRLLERIPHGLERAGIRAANRTAAFGQTRVRRILARALGTNIGAIRRAVTVHKASMTHSSATVRVKSRGINLIEFGARQTKTGISVRFAGQFSALVRRQIPHAFIGMGITGRSVGVSTNGNRLVFQRTGHWKRVKTAHYAPNIGKMREQIEGIYVTAQEIMRYVPGAMELVQSELRQQFRKEMSRQVKHIMESKGADIVPTEGAA